MNDFECYPECLWRKQIEKWSKMTKIDENRPVRNSTSPRSKSLKIDTRSRLDTRTISRVSKVLDSGWSFTRCKNLQSETVWWRFVCIMVKTSWISVTNDRFHFGKICEKCVKTRKKFEHARVVLPWNCLRQKMGVEKAVHMCGAVKIDQNLIFFHTRPTRFACWIAKNASKIQIHELGEFGMSVKWVSSRK